MKRYLFAKQFAQLTADELMTVCAELGLDGPTLLLRDGYWTTPDDLSAVKPFVQKAKEYGLEVTYCDSPLTKFDDQDERTLAVLSENGIKNVRLGYIPRPSGERVRHMAEELSAFAEKAAKMAGKHGVRAVIQLHGGVNPQTATAAYRAVKDLDPEYIGVKLDPGNHICQEGYEAWEYQVELLGEYICALGAKGAAMFRDGDPGVDNGWVRRFVPAQDGAIDYREIFGLLKKAAFNGPTILMPFYHGDNYDRMLSVLKEELAYLDGCYAYAMK